MVTFYFHNPIKQGEKAGDNNNKAHHQKYANMLKIMAM
jgi:hypothetical protein